MTVGTLLAIFGLIMILFRRSVVRQRSVFQKYHFGKAYSRGEAVWAEIVATLVGAVFFIVGVLVLLGVIKFQ